MDSTVIDERSLFCFFQENTRKSFLKMVEKYEAYIAPIMRAQGYKRINQKERTVIFSFGEMTFSRSRWKKGESIRIPVDEKLGLVPRARFSTELLYQLTKLSNFMPYRKVVSVLELLKQIYITKNTVQRALDKAGELLAAKEEYDSLGLPEETAKIKPEILYVEGDGLWVKRSHPEKKKKSMELTHFVVHTGSKPGKRNILSDKLEVVSTHHKKAKEQLLDLIYQHYDVTPETIIVTNSDGGIGYSPEYFKELVAGFKPGEHHHFWDAFHVKQALKTNLRMSSELTEKAFQALHKRDKKGLNIVLDTAESLLETEEQLENFNRFKRQLIRNFKYTEKPESRGLPSGSIGVIESLHRKISYRMKNNGMYWSEKGADTMSRTILLNAQGTLRDLFFGEWQHEYVEIQSVEDLSSADLSFSPKVDHTIPQLTHPIARYLPKLGFNL